MTTKYNPARTWTAENSVGIGGAYLCIYGMEGPGGYQFVGRTTQVWSRYPTGAPFAPESPWLLRFFDRISWYPVTAEELLDVRADLAAGRGTVDVVDDVFSLAEHERFLADNSASIAAFQQQQRAAFDRVDEPTAAPASAQPIAPVDGDRIDAPFVANVWKVEVAVGDLVEEGKTLVALEAMKMETYVTAPRDGVVAAVLAQPGVQVAPGDALIVLGPRGGAAVTEAVA